GERRRTFSRVEAAEASGSARPDVNQPSTCPKRRYDQLDRRRDALTFAAHDLRNRGILAIHQVHDLETRGHIDPLGTRIALLGGPRIGEISVCHGGELDDKITNAKDARAVRGGDRDRLCWYQSLFTSNADRRRGPPPRARPPGPRIHPPAVAPRGGTGPSPPPSGVSPPPPSGPARVHTPAQRRTSH